MILDSKSYKHLPNHVAFIMDGNRRWAKTKKLQIIEGHKKGSEVVKNIVKKSLKLNIRYLTFFSFSTENWNRSKSEIFKLQSLLKFYLETEKDIFVKEKIRFSFIGDIEKFDKTVRNDILNLKKITSNYNKLYLTLALSYGSRNEILNAFKCIKKKKIKNVSEKDISNHLMTKGVPDPDFVIRTSGEKRLSNFLLWQIAYSELYFTKTLWPDFTVAKYLSALKNYISRKRRFGGD